MLAEYIPEINFPGSGSENNSFSLVSATGLSLIFISWDNLWPLESCDAECWDPAVARQSDCVGESLSLSPLSPLNARYPPILWLGSTISLCVCFVNILSHHPLLKYFSTKNKTVILRVGWTHIVLFHHIKLLKSIYSSPVPLLSWASLPNLKYPYLKLYKYKTLTSECTFRVFLQQMTQDVRIV